METQPQMLYLMVLLACIAGFCDTTTFVAAHSLLSAHITGNLVVFASDLVHHVDSHAWTKLSSFPVFVVAVVASRWLSRRTVHFNVLLRTEGILLTVAGLLALGSAWRGKPAAGPLELVAMFIVFAMGVQNAFSTLASKQLYGPTTVMTGKLTQIVLDGAALLIPSMADVDRDADQKVEVFKQLPVFGAFVVGCVAGGLGAKAAGLGVVVVPGLALLLFGYVKGPVK